MKIRKNQKHMSDTEWKCFLDAYQAIRAGFIENVERPRLLEYVKTHSEAFGNPDWQVHIQSSSGANFFTWHRAFMASFEDRLRKENPSVTLPYWVAKEDDYPIELLEIPNVAQDKTPDISKNDLSIVDFGIDNFANFQAHVDGGYHSQVHGALGKAMGNPARASRDPAFWLHHAYIDKIWSEWTEIYWSSQPTGESDYRPPNHDGKLLGDSETLNTKNIDKLLFSVDSDYVYTGGIFNNLHRKGSEAQFVELSQGDILTFESDTAQGKILVRSVNEDQAVLDVRVYKGWRPVRDYTMSVKSTDNYNLYKGGKVAESIADVYFIRKVSTSGYTYRMSTRNGCQIAEYGGGETFSRLAA